MSQKLFENWTASKEALLEGLTGSKKQLVSVLMENQKSLMETAPAGAVAAGDIADFQQKIIPLIRRVIPGTIGTELVGTQPMAGPVGLIYSMRFTFGQATDAPGTLNDIAAGDEAFIYNSKMKRFYSSANVGTTGYPPALTAATSSGFAAATADYEGYGGRSMRLVPVKQTVTAGSRKLQARWTQEAQQDIGAQHGLNIESELTAALAAQIAHEIDNEILTDLLGLAGTVSTYDFAAAPAGFAPAYLGDRFAELGIMVNRIANEIGAKNKRGPANWLVGGHLITSILQSASKSVFAPAVSGNFESPTGNRLVGVMNGQMKVYSYNWGINDAYDINSGAVSAAGSTGEDILIGYKGGNSELDAGYFWCPYRPIESTGVVMDGNTFTPGLSLSTRYGKATFTNTATSLGNSSDYYGRLTAKNVAFS